MHLLVSIDISDWLQGRVDEFLEYANGEIELEELLDVAFKRRMLPDEDLLAAEEYLYDRLAHLMGGSDPETAKEFYGIVDRLSRGITLDRDHVSALSDYDELGYRVDSLIDNTMVVIANGDRYLDE